jgi:EAL domain-containing protein (putative c-di-GMP-specific phosphodiesterase class I)
MSTQPKERRDKAERRRGPDRRTRAVPIEVERRKEGDRRTGLERRLQSATASDQIHAAIGLVSWAAENGVMLDVDRWVLETAITRMRLALAKLTEDTAP